MGQGTPRGACRCVGHWRRTHDHSACSQRHGSCHDGRRSAGVAGGGIYAEDGFIVAVGTNDELPATADEVIDLTGHVVMPGLVNTHHHLYQTLTRAVPGAQDAGLFDWLRTLYPIWARMTAEHIQVSTARRVK